MSSRWRPYDGRSPAFVPSSCPEAAMVTELPARSLSMVARRCREHGNGDQ